MSLDTTVKLSISALLQGSLDFANPAAQLVKTWEMGLASGTGANAADMLFYDQRTLTASATEDLDLAGSLTGPLGTTLTFARIKGLIVYAAPGNTNNVNVTRPAANGVPLFLAASDGLPVVPGGTFYWGGPNAAGIAVTAGTGDLLTFTNSAGSTSVTYDVVILGASA